MTDHLGNVLATVLDRKTGHNPGGGATKYDYYNPDISSAQGYYPFGQRMKEWHNEISDSAYRFGYNGKLKNNEAYSAFGQYDYGERIYDPKIGRWFSVDPLQKTYPFASPYNFALNTPIQAKDPDGKVVLFINGQHGGTGGTAEYWGGYDKKVMDAIGDHSARYIDGALGGWKNTATEAAIGATGVGGWTGSLAGAAIRVMKNSNVNLQVRINSGKAQGYKDAASIIANLTDGESIKIVTHSMGTAFARGYVEGLKEYAGIFKPGVKLNFEYELDVNSFEGADVGINKSVNRTQNKTGGLDGGKMMPWLQHKMSVPTVHQIPQAENTTDPSDSDKGHAVDQMSSSRIPFIGNAGTETKAPVEQGNNNKDAQ